MKREIDYVPIFQIIRFAANMCVCVHQDKIVIGVIVFIFTMVTNMTSIFSLHIPYFLWYQLLWSSLASRVLSCSFQGILSLARPVSIFLNETWLHKNSPGTSWVPILLDTSLTLLSWFSGSITSSNKVNNSSFFYLLIHCHKTLICLDDIVYFQVTMAEFPGRTLLLQLLLISKLAAPSWFQGWKEKKCDWLIWSIWERC